MATNLDKTTALCPCCGKPYQPPTQGDRAKLREVISHIQLSPLERKISEVILSAGITGIDLGALEDRVYAYAEDPPENSKQTVVVKVSIIKRKLAPHGIELMNLGGRGRRVAEYAIRWRPNA